jgi:hypothetical protein
MGVSLGNVGEASYSRVVCVEEASGTGVCPYRGSFGNLGRGFSLPGTLRDGCRVLKGWVMQGPRDGASLSEEADCGGPQGRAPLLATLGYERKVLGMGISLLGGSFGQPGVGLSTGIL